MRFGGIIFKKWRSPEEWADAAREAGYSAVYFPVDYTAEDRVIDGYRDAARAADLDAAGAALAAGMAPLHWNSHRSGRLDTVTLPQAGS